MIRLPLSRTGSAESFDAAVQDHIKALTKHLLGKPGVPAPRAGELVEMVIARKQQDGPVATRGPDTFYARPYTIYDDKPVTPEVQMLRDSINQGA